MNIHERLRWFNSPDCFCCFIFIRWMQILISLHPFLSSICIFFFKIIIRCYYLFIFRLDSHPHRMCDRWSGRETEVKGHVFLWLLPPPPIPTPPGDLGWNNMPRMKTSASADFPLRSHQLNSIPFDSFQVDFGRQLNPIPHVEMKERHQSAARFLRNVPLRHSLQLLREHSQNATTDGVPSA